MQNHNGRNPDDRFHSNPSSDAAWGARWADRNLADSNESRGGRREWNMWNRSGHPDDYTQRANRAYDRATTYGGYGYGSDFQDRGSQLSDRPFPGKGPKGYSRSDERIREEVCECLSSGHIDASDIDVTVRGGEVMLSGTVADRRTKRMAEEMLDHIRGVKDVENKLKIQAADKKPGVDFSDESSDAEKASSETTRTTHSKRASA